MKEISLNREDFANLFGGANLQNREKPLDEVNVRGYAALIQEMFDLADCKGNYLRNNNQLDPFKIIKIDPSRAKDLVEVVEAGLGKLSSIDPRYEEVIRLYFALDQPKDSGFMTNEAVGKKLKNLNNGKEGICGERVRQLVRKSIRILRHPSRSREIKRVFWE